MSSDGGPYFSLVPMGFIIFVLRFLSVLRVSVAQLFFGAAHGANQPSGTLGELRAGGMNQAAASGISATPQATGVVTYTTPTQVVIFYSFEVDRGRPHGAVDKRFGWHRSRLEDVAFHHGSEGSSEVRLVMIAPG